MTPLPPLLLSFQLFMWNLYWLPLLPSSFVGVFLPSVDSDKEQSYSSGKSHANRMSFFSMTENQQTLIAFVKQDGIHRLISRVQPHHDRFVKVESDPTLPWQACRRPASQTKSSFIPMRPLTALPSTLLLSLFISCIHSWLLGFIAIWCEDLMSSSII